jgi:hypothetical protein
MVRYYGCISSHSSLRLEVVPEPPPAVHNPLLDDGAGQLALGFDDSEGQLSGKRRRWAWLHRHVWELDVSTCARCGGPMKWVEVATEPDALLPGQFAGQNPYPPASAGSCFRVVQHEQYALPLQGRDRQCSGIQTPTGRAGSSGEPKLRRHMYGGIPPGQHSSSFWQATRHTPTPSSTGTQSASGGQSSCASGCPAPGSVEGVHCAVQ